MLPRLFVMSVAVLASFLVAAQSVPASRLDAATAGGKIQVRSPGDCKSSAFSGPMAVLKAWMDQGVHLAKAHGEYGRIAGRWLK